MLPAVPVHARQHLAQGSQEALVFGLAELLASAFGIPVIEILIAFQSGAHQ